MKFPNDSQLVETMVKRARRLCPKCNVRLKFKSSNRKGEFLFSCPSCYEWVIFRIGGG